MSAELEAIGFPVIEQARSDLGDPLAWIAEHRQRLIDAVEQNGAVLMRGFALVTDQDFDAAIRCFSLPVFTYEESLSNAIRKSRTERVFTANEAPPQIEIFLHHEMAQTPTCPAKLFFFCERAAPQGGATPLCRSDLLWNEMKGQMPQFANNCASLGVRYTSVMPSHADATSGQGRSWKSTLSCDSETAAESRLSTLGYSWQWLDDGSLKVTTPVLAAVRELESGIEVFFNQLLAAFMGWKDSRNDREKSVCFGDGSEILDADMQQVAQLSQKYTIDLQWQNGDMAIVDNYMVMHGRRPFTGDRRILASLTA